MQKENKNQEDKPSSEEKNANKIDYTIQTMDSDLKKSSPQKGSVELFEEKEKQEEKEKKEVPKEKPQPKKTFNPFLDDLKPVEKFKSELEKSESEKKIEATQKTKAPNPLSSEGKKALEKQIPVVPKPPNANSHTPIGEKSLKKKKPANFLLIFIFVLSLITFGSGLYYYFNLKNTEPQTEPQAESQVEPSLEQEVASKPSFPEKLKNSQSLNIEQDSSLAITVKNQKEDLLNSANYYQVKQASEILNSSEILSSLDIQLPEDVLSNLGEAWIMLYNQEGVLKLNLILEVIEKPEDVKQVLVDNEYRLPQLLKPLFVDEDFVLQGEDITFRDSEVLDGIRYYNLVEGFDNKAIDWGFIDNKYLIITTSKETAGVLIEDANKNSPEESTQLNTPKENLTENSDEKNSEGIYFSEPKNGTRVQPGSEINVTLSISNNNLDFKKMTIATSAGDSEEFLNPPYTTSFTIPDDAYGEFSIFALGDAGTNKTLYSAETLVYVDDNAELESIEINDYMLLNLGKEMRISVMGIYSDGSRRDLGTKEQGTIYKSSDDNIVSVTSDGLFKANKIGTAFVSVKPLEGDETIVEVMVTE